VTIDEAGQQVYAKNLPLSQLAPSAMISSWPIMRRLARTHLGSHLLAAADPFGSLNFRVAEYHKPHSR